jgi:hypothetical protein
MTPVRQGLRSASTAREIGNSAAKSVISATKQRPRGKNHQQVSHLSEYRRPGGRTSAGIAHVGRVAAGGVKTAVRSIMGAQVMYSEESEAARGKTPGAAWAGAQAATNYSSAIVPYQRQSGRLQGRPLYTTLLLTPPGLGRRGTSGRDSAVPCLRNERSCVGGPLIAGRSKWTSVCSPMPSRVWEGPR